MNTIQRAGRAAGLALLDAGAQKKRWTPEERAKWTRAFNACQRLAGKKLVWNNGRIVKDRPRRKG